VSLGNDRIGLRWSLAVAGIVVIAAVVGFLWFSALQSSGSPSLWLALCRAAGLPVRNAQADTRTIAAAVPSDVVWTPQIERVVEEGNAARGATLAGGCAGCHGADGRGVTDQFPDLAGQPADALFKQLDDFHAGKRINATMQAMTAALTEQQIADLAAHFASLPPPSAPASHPPRLAMVGDPERGLAPCSACHGPMGHKLGAPVLVGQKAAYLQAQLEAFAAGTRRNDINQQMREVARSLRPAEIGELVRWYSGESASASTPAATPQ
jgi:cytochrome c553